MFQAKSTLTALVIVLASTWYLFSDTAIQEKQPPKGNLMQRKLQHAQKTLEGVATNNLELIEKNAEELIKISQTAEWKSVPTEKYLMYSEEFRREAKELIRATKSKNEDAASLAYIKMSLVCFNCHKHVRETKIALNQP